MIKKILLTLGLIICMFNFAYSIESFPFECEFERAGSSLAEDLRMMGYHSLFSASANLSAHVSINNSYYNKFLNQGFNILCKGKNSNGEVSFTIKDKQTTDLVCDGEEQELMYFTGDENARVARTYVQGFHEKVLCGDFAKIDGVMNIVWNDQPLRNYDYGCLFKTNAQENGLISSCDATYSSGNDKYDYTVWGILFDSVDTLNCRSDCTSKIDNRIYSFCSVKIKTCADVPMNCDGALVGSWVYFNATHEIRCGFNPNDPNGGTTPTGSEVLADGSSSGSNPWKVFRQNLFLGVDLDVISTDSDCPNLIKTEYPVLFNNEQVIMNIYVCSNN